MEAKIQDLNRMKDVIHEFLFVEKSVFIDQNHLKLFSFQLKPNNKEKNSLNFASLLTFKKLLICSKKIPFQIPVELLKASFSDQIKYLLVDENDEHYLEQKVYFEDLRENFNNPNFKDYLKASFKEIQFQITFCNFKNDAEKVVDALDLYLKVPDQRFTDAYLENVQLHFKDLICYFSASKNQNTDLENSDIDNCLLKTLIASNEDPFWLVTKMLSGSSLKKFKECRPELQNADRIFENKIECQRDGNTINISQPLVEYYESDYHHFIKMANKFSAVFSSVKDPYNMMKDIDDTYTKIKEEIFGHDEISDDDEKNFIINLFIIT